MSEVDYFPAEPDPEAYWTARETEDDQPDYSNGNKPASIAEVA